MKVEMHATGVGYSSSAGPEKVSACTLQSTCLQKAGDAAVHPCTCAEARFFLAVRPRIAASALPHCITIR